MLSNYGTFLPLSVSVQITIVANPVIPVSIYCYVNKRQHGQFNPHLLYLIYIHVLCIQAISIPDCYPYRTLYPHPHPTPHSPNQQTYGLGYFSLQLHVQPLDWISYVISFWNYYLIIMTHPSRRNISKYVNVILPYYDLQTTQQ